MTASARLDSVDALRGLTVAAMLLVNNPGDWGHVPALLTHAQWHGCTPADLIFPFFLFLVGASITLSVGGRVDQGLDARQLSRGVLSRALRIVLLGLVLHAIAYWLMDTRAFRPLGVLQRIGVCFGVAGWLALHAKPRTQWGCIAAILLGYWTALALGGPLTKEGNLASRLDTLLLGRWAYEFDPATGLGHEPEGVLSTFPAIATTLLGVRAGAWLRLGNPSRLLQFGAGALVLGWLWSLLLPLNKQLWTSSFVLWTGGWAMLALAAAHQLIDRHSWPALGRSFGINAIAAYAGSWVMVCVLSGLRWQAPLYDRGFGWMTPQFGAYAPSLSFAMAFVAFWWLVMALLDRQRLYFKI